MIFTVLREHFMANIFYKFVLFKILRVLKAHHISTLTSFIAYIGKLYLTLFIMHIIGQLNFMGIKFL